MFKKILVALMLALPMLATAQTVKIGLVDTNAVVTSLPDTQQANTTLTEFQKKFETAAKELESEYNRKIEELNALPAGEPETIRAQKTNDIQQYQAKIQQFLQNADAEIQKKQQELYAPIMQKVKDAIESVGREGGYTLIQESGMALYYSAPAEDITAAVKTKLGIK